MSAKKTEDAPTPSRAEVSNYEIGRALVRRGGRAARDDVAAVLRSSYREVQVQIPVSLRDGRIHVFSGYRVQHNGARGPTRAASASTPRSTSTRCARSRSLMTWKTAIVIPFGGAKGGVNCVRDKLERGRAPGGRPLVHGQDREGARPHARHPGAGRRHQRPGDGLDDGRVRQAARPHAGHRDRQADRARGLAWARGRHRPRRRLPVPRRPPPSSASTPEDTRFVVQGYGNVGSWARASCRAWGARWSAPPTQRRHPQRRGIDAEALAEHVARGRDSATSRARSEIAPDELLALECDVFIPAALGGMIHEDNADSIAASCRGRGRQQPDHPEGRRDPRRQGRLRGPRRDGQRRRRRRLLLRVGPEPPALPLGRGRGQRPARRRSCARPTATCTSAPRRTTSRCAWPPTRSASSGSSRPPARGYIGEGSRRGLPTTSRGEKAPSSPGPHSR